MTNPHPKSKSPASRPSCLSASGGPIPIKCPRLMTPASCQAAHPFPTLYPRQAASRCARPIARPIDVNIIIQHDTTRVITRFRSTRSTISRIPRIAGYRPRPLYSTAWHRPVRRVSPPLREGRSNRSSSACRRTGAAVSTRKSRTQHRNPRSGRSADNLNLTTLALTKNQPAQPSGATPAKHPKPTPFPLTGTGNNRLLEPGASPPRSPNGRPTSGAARRRPGGCHGLRPGLAAACYRATLFIEGELAGRRRQ